MDPTLADGARAKVKRVRPSPREQAAFIETHFLTPADRDRRRLVGLVLYAAA
jgi:hypothetical protein